MSLSMEKKIAGSQLVSIFATTPVRSNRNDDRESTTRKPSSEKRARGKMRLVMPLALMVLACAWWSNAFAQNLEDSTTDETTLSLQPPQPRFVVRTPQYSNQVHSDLIQAASSPLKTWNGSFTSGGTTFSFNMVGTPPSSNASTTVQAIIVPIKIVITKGRTKTTFDPSHVLSNGRTVTQNTVVSPIFNASTTFTQGVVNVGTTQYIDAYQRANFWGTVQHDPNYHVLLGGPTVLAEQTLSPPAANGKTGSPFGFTAGLVDINWFDGQLQSIMSRLTQIQPNVFPIFLTYDVYLTQNGGCCIGGYHSATGSASNPQSYSHATYVDHATFAQDVSALSHEVGEWVADPLVANNGNNTPCGILENGDPLEGTANFGDHPFTVNGFTYHLQDLAMMPYFGAPPSTSVNGWFSFENAALSVCSNGS